jgi:putative iron-only hydrogenase system regulator
MKRIGVIGIVVSGDRSVAMEIQKLLSEYSDIIIGRMGVPDKVNNISAISVIVEGTNEQISALSGKLGKLENVNIKSAITTMIIDK